MQVAEIVNNSSAEVKGHFADVIWFQGCPFKCPYCFNPELQAFEGGREMYWWDIVKKLSDYSDVVVLTGGDPLYQDSVDLEGLIRACQIRGKKVIIETMLYNDRIIECADKVYASFPCYGNDVNYNVVKTAEKLPNVEIIVVVGYTGFDLGIFVNLLHSIDKDIWIKRYYGHKTSEYFESVIKTELKNYNKPFKVLEKLHL